MFTKKINLFLFSLMLALGVQAQKTIVKGTIEGLKKSNLRFEYQSSGPDGRVWKFDTVKVKKGKFAWKVQLDEPQRVNILFGENTRKGSSFFADKGGKIRIAGHENKPHDLLISGSSMQKEAEAYFASIKDISNQLAEISQQYTKANKDEKIAIEKNWERTSDQKTELLKRYVSAHPKSYFSLYLVAYEMTSEEYPKMKPLYDLLDPALLQSESGKKLSQQLAAAKRRALGEPMLDFTQNNNEGRPVRFSDFRGKYVLVDFWASWCMPCRAENPNVLAAYNRYKDKNFTVLGISLDEEESRWKKAIQDDKLPWTQVSDLKGFENEVAVYYGIGSIPATFLIDPQGKIIAIGLHGEYLHKKLAELLDK